MDQMVTENLFGGIYKGKKVFITGHTGFKGSWLSFWLVKMGAIVKGYSLAPNTNPSHWDLLNLDIDSVINDIRNRETLKKEIISFQPDIIFHLAAQPLVRKSYENPIETYETNVIGALNLFEACRVENNVKAIINITTDKCYENKEWVYGYRENDSMGGYDPYSSSKGCVELLTASYRNSYWNIDKYGAEHETLLASVRAGNVIGGGDWALDRLIPDIVKAANNNKEVYIRNPKSTRPWQFVLEPLSGYLVLGEKLLKREREYASGWNFGPDDEGNLTVAKVSELCKKYWEKININIEQENKHVHEANLLKLDCSKAHKNLKWFPVWGAEQIFNATINWYKNFYETGEVNTEKDLEDFIGTAVSKKLKWTM